MEKDKKALIAKLKAEKFEIDKRYLAIADAIKNPEIALSQEKLMNEQKEILNNYSIVLFRRIDDLKKN
ncbi:MAG: hypothetical protein ACLUDD_04920 [Lactobacillus kalixensis]|uniref:hypothetical protein n=1 Tax=Lactobacillus kalixensis TaxID=227944 RepID=UPI003991E2DF